MTKTTKRKKQQKMIRKSHLEPKCRGGGGSTLTVKPENLEILLQHLLRQMSYRP